MITPTDIGRVLAKCSGYRPDKTPQASELVIMAWHEHFEDFPHLTVDDALEAVKRYHRDPQDRMIQPADISRVARDIHQDRSQRWDDDDQADHEAFLEAKSAGRVGSPQEWAALKAANRTRLAELINPVAAGKGLNTIEGETA